MGRGIGVYICKCGTNIAENVDVESLARSFGEVEGVAIAGTHSLLCSEEGKEFLRKEITANGLDRLVVAACSPRQHEATFRGVCSSAEMNPYMMQMANIREMCAWTTPDPAEATAKAKVLINGALRRVRLHEALTPPEIEITPDALVIGAGVAGISAAMLLAQKGRKVCLVEKAPCVGGMVVQYEDVFPNIECGSCMLEPLMDEVLHSHEIETLTYSEVIDIKGFLGNFIVKIRKRPRRVAADMCYGCAQCYDACPVSVPDEFCGNMRDRKAIYTPFSGALPNVPVIDESACLRFTTGEECTKCADSCGFGAIDFSQEEEIIERKAGAIVIATGSGLYDVSALPALGYGKLDNVVTTLEMEKIISGSGPTEGKALLKNKKEAKNIAIVHCAGSRDENACNYCSGTCCMEALKLNHLLQSKNEGMSVTHFFTDWCLPGKSGQAFYNRVAAEPGSRFTRVEGISTIKVSKGAKGKINVAYKDPAGEAGKAGFDMVVLAPAVIPGKETKRLSAMFQATLDGNGFFKEAHNRISQIATNMEGVFVAGCASGPTDIAGATSSGKAAAGEILSVLVKGERLELEAITAHIDSEICTGCKICVSLCPYKAIGFDEKDNVARVNEVLCRGCGTCAGACPSGAAAARNFTTGQIFAEIEGALA